MAGNPYLAAAQAGGSLLQAYGSIAAGRSQAKAYKEQASLLGLSAQELRSRAKENIQRRYRQASQEQSLLMSSNVASGGTAGTATDLDSNNLQFLQAQQDVSDIMRETEWQAKQMEYEATTAQRAAKASKKAGILGAVGSILSGGSQSYKDYKNY